MSSPLDDIVLQSLQYGVATLELQSFEDHDQWAVEIEWGRPIEHRCYLDHSYVGGGELDHRVP